MLHHSICLVGDKMVKVMAVVQTDNNLVVNRIVLADDDNSFTIADHTLVEETEATGQAMISGTWDGSKFVPNKLWVNSQLPEDDDE